MTRWFNVAAVVAVVAQGAHGATNVSRTIAGTSAASTAVVARAMLPLTGENEDLGLWRSPGFQRAFLGTYGVNAEIEPKPSTAEREQIENVLAMMKAKGGVERARLYLEQIVTPASSAAFDFTLANIYFQRDQPVPAAKWYARAIDKFPSFQRAHKNLGIARSRTGDQKAAIGSLTRAIELGANDAITYGLLGYVYLMTEQFSAAESAYRQATMLQPDSTDWKLGLTRCLLRQGKFAETAALCDELIRRDPARSDYWLLQANAYLGLKQPLKAAQNYEYLNLSGQANVAILNTLGDIYVNENLFDCAADAYIEALDLEPTADPKRLLRNVEVLLARGGHEEAGRLLERVKVAADARLSTEDRKRLLKLEARLAAAKGSAGDEQARLLEQIVALDPLDGEALILLGQYYASTGGVEKACFLYERAEGMEKFEAEASLRHAQCLVRDGRYQQAVPLLKRTQELRPREDVTRYLEQVERVARSKN